MSLSVKMTAYWFKNKQNRSKRDGMRARKFVRDWFLRSAFKIEGVVSSLRVYPRIWMHLRLISFESIINLTLFQISLSSPFPFSYLLVSGPDISSNDKRSGFPQGNFDTTKLVNAGQANDKDLDKRSLTKACSISQHSAAFQIRSCLSFDCFLTVRLVHK